MNKRDLSDQDIKFFEARDGLLPVINFFVQTITMEKQGVVNAADFDYYLSFTEMEFGERFDEEKRNNSK